MLTGIITNVEQVAVAESISAVQSNMPSATVSMCLSKNLINMNIYPVRMRIICNCCAVCCVVLFYAAAPLFSCPGTLPAGVVVSPGTYRS